MIRFRGSGISLEIDPDDGGRITSLIALGRQWLSPSTPRSAAELFVDASTGGWDEVVPTVQACQLPDGTELRDHGDAWRSSWRLLSHSQNAVTMSVELETVGVTLERTVRSTLHGVRLEYEARSRSRVPVPLLWCGHPLFDASTGARLVEAPGTSAPTELTQEYPSRGTRMLWPRSITRGSAVKAFASGMAGASVVHPDGAELRLSWSLPHAGFYWDDGEFSAGPVVAIEPSTGASDSAARVLEELPTVAVGSPLRWWMALDA